MAKLDPSKGTAAWDAGVRGSGQRWLDGINGQTVNPAQKAAQSADLWAQNTIASKQKFIDSLNATPLSYIQSQAQAVGVVGYTSGASKGKNKYNSFASQFYP